MIFNTNFIIPLFLLFHPEVPKYESLPKIYLNMKFTSVSHHLMRKLVWCKRFFLRTRGCSRRKFHLISVETLCTLERLSYVSTLKVKFKRQTISWPRSNRYYCVWLLYGSAFIVRTTRWAFSSSRKYSSSNLIVIVTQSVHTQMDEWHWALQCLLFVASQKIYTLQR